jgi:hypothetical protein
MLVEFLPETADVDVDGPRLDLGGIGVPPDAFEQLLPV